MTEIHVRAAATSAEVKAAVAGLSEAIECLRVPGESAAVSSAGLAATAAGPAEQSRRQPARHPRAGRVRGVSAGGAGVGVDGEPAL